MYLPPPKKKVGAFMRIVDIVFEHKMLALP